MFTEYIVNKDLKEKLTCHLQLYILLSYSKLFSFSLKKKII